MRGWNDDFIALFDRCVGLYRAGNRDYGSYYSDEELAFLASIGCRTREFFDFVEDYCEENQPSKSTALLVASVRRQYFVEVQKGEGSSRILTRDDCPGFGEKIGGIRYLPRLIVKARAKLRGELDPDLMYCCGGDRKFFRSHGGIHPADFLRQVWLAEEDEESVVRWVGLQQERGGD